MEVVLRVDPETPDTPEQAAFRTQIAKQVQDIIDRGYSPEPIWDIAD